MHKNPSVEGAPRVEVDQKALQDSEIQNLDNGSDSVEDYRSQTVPRPYQSSVIARDFPPDILILIFNHFCRYDLPYEVWNHLQFCVRSDITASAPLDAWRRLINAASVCALWRSVLLSTPTLHPKVVGANFPSDKYPYRATPSPEAQEEQHRRQANLCKLMLQRSSSGLVCLSLIADSTKQAPEYTDRVPGRRHAIARVMCDFGRARERWKELAVSQVYDTALFAMLFYDTGAPDEEFGHRLDAETTCDDERVALNRLQVPLEPLKPAPHLTRLILGLEDILDERGTNYSDLHAGGGNSLDPQSSLSFRDVDHFISGMANAFPALAHFYLRIERLVVSRVEGLMVALDDLFPADCPTEPPNPTSYQAWRRAYVKDHLRQSLPPGHDTSMFGRFHLELFIKPDSSNSSRGARHLVGGLVSLRPTDPRMYRPTAFGGGTVFPPMASQPTSTPAGQHPGPFLFRRFMRKPVAEPLVMGMMRPPTPEPAYVQELRRQSLI